MGTDGPAAAEVMLMLLADARLPTGAHTQSGGLEPALAHGMSVAEVPEYLRLRLRTVAAVEAGAAVAARHAVLHPSGDLGDALRSVDIAWRARTISPALRENAELLGRGYLRLVRRLWPEAIAVQALSELGRPVRAVVTGVAAALAGLAAGQLARLIGYDDAQTVAAAALKISPMDPVTAVQWVLGVAADIDLMSAGVENITAPQHIPARTAPMVETWAQLHARTGQRLFRA